MNFEPFYANKVGDSEESIHAEKEEQPTRQRSINLTNNTTMVIRNVPDVVRVPFFQMPTDTENYFYCLLVQYVPFYSEDKLIDKHYNAPETFLAREQQLRQLRILKHIVQEIDNLRLHLIRHMCFQSS
ncbi:ATP-dependent DNA helicase [Trichonephila inaurata madagascariensis]|uniref:ATP-dependent DNA helicase n=1 Tax=Trichonephila inaurata madagascariensis TaxID=2747483 RepID=A0A8X6WX81_9ARAC|nr:ATP-dependent DNA helicase [Trichonephila inaurata madagascariensis]